MKQANVVLCPDCGHENIEGSDNCENCGADLRTLDVPETMQPASESDLSRPLGEAQLSKPLTIDERATVREAIKQLRAEHVGALVVVRGSEVVGIFTERDVLKKVAATRQSLDVAVTEVMTRDPVVLRDDDSMAVALNKMGVGGFRHIPLTHEGKLVAIVSVRDVLKWVLGRYLG